MPELIIRRLLVSWSRDGLTSMNTEEPHKADRSADEINTFRDLIVEITGKSLHGGTVTFPPGNN